MPLVPQVIKPIKVPSMPLVPQVIKQDKKKLPSNKLINR